MRERSRIDPASDLLTSGENVAQQKSASGNVLIASGNSVMSSGSITLSTGSSGRDEAGSLKLLAGESASGQGASVFINRLAMNK